MSSVLSQPADVPVASGLQTSTVPIYGGGKVFAVLVFGFAFLLASMPVGQSDFWLHLATGRALVEGGFSFGSEPFTLVQTGYWVNPSWLYDVLLFGLYQTVGGSAIVIGNALLVSALSVLLMLSCRGDKGFYLPGLAVALALIALAPWLSVQPRCVSFALAAWTTWFLEVKRGEKNVSLVSFWPLLVVFALWANLDRYFIVGPFLVGLYALGSVLSKGHDADKIPAGLFLASLAVCLLNPHHVYIFSAPWQLELTGLEGALNEEPSFRSVFTNPLQQVYFTRFLTTPPGLAFWLLTLVGFVSFLVNARQWPWAWGFAWASFSLLSLVKTQVIPFFVIISVPFLVQNLRAWRPARTTALRRTAAFALVLALLIAAWPGWLQIGPYGPRSWAAEIDPTMGRLGKRWLDGHRQPTNAVFNFSPETGNYLAWLCPQLKCFVNSHLHLTPQDVVEYRAIRQGLTGRTLPNTAERNWRAVLRRHQVSVIIVHGRDLGSTMDALQNLFASYRECPLLRLGGRGAVFGWRDPVDPESVKNNIIQTVLAGSSVLPAGPLLSMVANGGGSLWRPDPYAQLEMDMLREAFSTAATQLKACPEQDAGPKYWWDASWRPRWTPSADRDEADALLTYFDSRREMRTKRHLSLGRLMSTADVISAGANFAAPPYACYLGLVEGPLVTGAILSSLDDGPVEALYLALRAAHRAIYANPDDAQAYFLLGEAYRRLEENTSERTWGAITGPMRTPQMTTAYQHAITLEPGFWQAHERLARAFGKMDYKDLALEHWQQVYRRRAIRPAQGESREQFQKRLQVVKQKIDELDDQVQSARDRLEANSASLRVVDRAHMAGRLGLTGHSLNVLLKSDLAAFGERGMAVELGLLLNTGQADTVKDWLVPTHEELLGSYSYHLIKGRMEAARGDLAEAERSLTDTVNPRRGAPRRAAAIGVISSLLGDAARHGRFVWLDQVMDHLTAKITVEAFEAMNMEARSLVLRGMLAVEAGANQHAGALFERALAFWDSPLGAGFTEPEANIGRRIARYFVTLLKNAERG